MTLPKADYTEADVHAMRAFLSGTATAEQQLRVRRFILEGICHIFDSPYVSGGDDRETFVMIGRHQVGVLITSATTPEVLAAAQLADKIKLGPPKPPKRGTRHETPT